jgi:hypothetical protein
MLKRRKSLNF